MNPSNVKKKIHAEFRVWAQVPKIKKDWGVVWVLSGYDTGWGRGSDTRRRLEEGMRVAKKISRLSGKPLPAVYISGYDEHNTNLRKWQREGLFRNRYTFRENKLLVGPQEHIRHTGDQFRLFPRKFLKGNKKIVIVTDAYHIPRARRHLLQRFPDEKNRFVFYPAKPIKMSSADVNKETQKIIEYAYKGIIPLFADTKKIALSGATGLLGSRFLSVLAGEEYRTVVSLGREAFKNEKLLHAKLTGADLVVHLAGVNSAHDPSDFAFNTDSTKMLLDALRRSAPNATFVYASSFSVYHNPKKGASVRETSPLHPRNAYGRSKLAAEKLVHAFSKRYGIPSVILRISNMYGPHANISRTIVDQVRSAVRDGEPLTLRSPAVSTRDFVYVDDVVSALMAVLELKFKRAGSQIFNICTGQETSIATLVRMAEGITHKKLDLAAPGEVLGPPTYWRGSFQKAKKGLQWQPKVKIRAGLRKTLK